MFMSYATYHLFNTDIFGYSDTGLRNTLLTMTVLANPMLPKIVTVSKYLLTVTLISYSEGVNVTKDVCTAISLKQWQVSAHFTPARWQLE